MCMMSYASSRFRNGSNTMCRPSPFLRDIDPKYLRMMQGTTLGEERHAGMINRYRQSYHSPEATHSVINPVPRRDLPRTAPAVPLRSPAPASPAPAGADTGEFTRHTLADIDRGMEILHERFGRGVIEEIDEEPSGERITVLFSGADRKKLMLKFARFKILQ